jgi:hypothetical protein
MELENEEEESENVNEESNVDYEELDKLRKTIEFLNNSHHIEIAKIFKNNNIKLTENNNGIFINLNNISSKIIDEIKNYINFVKQQESLLNIDETKKEDLEKIFFKDKTDVVIENE